LAITIGGVGSFLPRFFVLGFDDSRRQSVLRTVGFVCDEDNVAALAQHLVLSVPSVGTKFLDGGGGNLKLGFEINSIFF
jgi:hypothetical protein